MTPVLYVRGLSHQQVVTLVSGQKVLLVPNVWQTEWQDSPYPGIPSTKLLEIQQELTTLGAYSVLEYDEPRPSIWNFVSRLMKKLRNSV